MFDITIGIDGKVYLSGTTQNPHMHFSQQITICLNDLIEESVRKVLKEPTQMISQLTITDTRSHS